VAREAPSTIPPLTTATIRLMTTTQANGGKGGSSKGGMMGDMMGGKGGSSKGGMIGGMMGGMGAKEA
jgi:hypothetical protein